MGQQQRVDKTFQLIVRNYVDVSFSSKYVSKVLIYCDMQNVNFAHVVLSLIHTTVKVAGFVSSTFDLLT